MDGVQALVLELIEGETLRERLIRGALPLAEALRCALAISEALAAAHEKGIVHRDLKPSNIKITSAGTLKVLDFGLAKATNENGVESSLPSTTITVDAQDRAIAGTAAYMSPEQARGQVVDKRTDIWAFGCLLYEMLCGRQAFGGDTVTDVLARIVERDADFERMPSRTPAIVRDLIRHCLQKDTRRRLHDIADARIVLEDALSSPETGSSNVQAGIAPKRIRWLAVGLVLGMIAAGSIAWQLTPTPPTNIGAIRFTIEPPPMPNPYAFSISPDGRTVAFLARRTDGRLMVSVRPVSSVDARWIPGTEGAVSPPFWSPDSRYVGFASISTIRQLKIVDISGGRPQIVCELLRANPFQGNLEPQQRDRRCRR